MNNATTIDDYIKSFPKEVQTILQKIRTIAKRIVPDAEEAMKYGIPTFILKKKNMVHFGAYQHHIGFYPTPDVIVAFKKELVGYKTAKGSIQFPIDEPMPFALIEQMTAYRATQMNDKKTIKKKKQ